MEETKKLKTSSTMDSAKEKQIKISKGFFVLNKKTKFEEDYKLEAKLGEGAFGVVGKCR